MNLKFQTKLDKSGRVILPSQILGELRLTPGTALIIEEKDGMITLQPVAEDPAIIERDGLLVLHAQLTADITDIVKESRQRRIATLLTFNPAHFQRFHPTIAKLIEQPG
ncbi:MAG: AbrB/MazE/SpoVT family DNA-binding domain-containing protein [bacterium]|nr:AbrB/MazE/SpoVT family DNA-binding domain-containing protein [bacterium]